MKSFAALGFALVFFPSIAGAQVPPEPPATNAAGPRIETVEQKASYGIGLNIGNSLLDDGLVVDPGLVAQGIADALAQRDPRISPEALREAMIAFQQASAARQAELMAAAAEKNQKEGAAFLAANKEREGVVTLPSGLQYRVLQKGNGPTPKATDTVRTHYRGTLIDGTEFDSSYSRNEPSTFGVTQVIKGWTEALQLMQVGDRWQLFVPSELAYAEQRRSALITPHSTLIFEIELLAIEP